MKVIGSVVVGNELPLVKYVIPYWKNVGFNKLYVYNDSNDGTIDLIKSYNLDFVEIVDFDYERDAESYTPGWVFDYKKLEKHTTKIYELINEVSKTNEETWFMMFDFDEVITPISFDTVHSALVRAKYINDGYNYFSGRMLNLISETEPDVELTHGTRGIRASYWPYYGNKVTIIKINDITGINFMSLGNHNFFFSHKENVKMNNIEELGFLYPFHLKYLTKEIFEYKTTKLCKREDWETFQKNNFRDYEYNRAVSFPLENYFMTYGFNKYFSFYDKTVSDGVTKTGGLTE